jgi:O-antigen ligase/tetratricopeptide (TPR) repeat protein
MKLEKYLLTILRLGVFLVFLTPLIYTGSTIFPFIFGKTLYFRGIVEILFAFYLLLILIYPKYRPKNSLLFSAILIYSFVYFLAMIFGVDASRSFWSNHERMMGYFTFLHALALFIIAASVFRDKEDWKKVFIATTIVSFILNFLGIYQYFQDGAFLHLSGGGKVYSTLGNFIYYGGYCLWHIFIALAYLLKRRVSLGERIFWALSLIINAFGLILAGSRGPFLGALSGAILALILYIIFSKSKKTRLALSLLLVAILVISVFIWLNRNSDFVKNRPILSHLTDISFMTTTGSTRLLNWGVAWDSFKERPLLGWGPDNYYIAFNKHYDPRFYEFGIYETWQDHAHNIIFDTLNEGGVLGLLSYLFIYIAFYVIVFRALKNKENEDISLIIFPAVAVASYFVQNLFVFDTLTILLLFYTILSFVHSSYGSASGGELKIVVENQPLSVSKKNKHKPSSRLEAKVASETGNFWAKIDPVYKNTIIIGVILSALIFVYYVDIGPFRVSRMTISALRIYQSDFNQGYKIMKKALSIYSPYAKETRDEFSKMIFSLVNTKSNLTKEELKKFFDEATEELKKTEKEHPKDVYIHMYLLQWYFTMANIFQNWDYITMSEEEIGRALELSPKRQQLRHTIAKVYTAMGQYDKAIQMLIQTIELNPKIGDSYWLLALVYAKMDKVDLAYDNFIKAINSPVAPTSLAPFDFQKALEIVANKTTSTKILDWFVGNSANMGLNAKNFIELAKKYKELGDKEGMKRVLSIATSTDAGVTKEVEELIRD